MWRFGVALADAGWHADAVDLRGHGTAPRALDYSIDAYAADLHVTRPRDGLGVGSRRRALARRCRGDRGGGIRSRAGPDGSCWSTRRSTSRRATATSCARARSARSPTRRSAAVRAEHPHWHPHDVELKALSAQQASRWAVEQTSVQNAAWDVRDAASRLTVPTHVIGSDPKVYSIFTGALADEVLRQSRDHDVGRAGAGHSPHRDKPEATIAEFLTGRSPAETPRRGIRRSTARRARRPARRRGRPPTKLGTAVDSACCRSSIGGTVAVVGRDVEGRGQPAPLDVVRRARRPRPRASPSRRPGSSRPTARARS